MIIKFVKPLTCTDSVACSDALLAKLETRLGLLLHADSPTRTGLEGSLTVYHVQNRHEISVEIYNTTRNNPRLKVGIMPTRDQVNNALESTITANPSLFTRIRSLFNP